MTTNTEIQVIPAIYNGTITKLEKRIAASWGQLERAVQSKDITATRTAVNRVAHLEELRQRHVALEQRIVETISNGSSAQTAPVANPQPDVQTPVARPKKKPVRPVEIKFGSVKKHIRYATEIPVAIANWLIEQGKELPITANFIHPSEAGFSQSATTKKLKSGQYMRVGHNQEALLHKARELLDGCGYEGVQIKVLLDNGITLSA